MLKTKIKQSMLEGLALRQMIEEVSEKIYWNKEKKKPLEVSLKEHFGKMIDRVDPLQVAAVAGTAYVIKFGIDWTQYQLANVGPIISILTPSGFITGKVPLKISDNEVLEWVLSFSIAYMVVVHGLDIAGGLIPLASKFLSGIHI
jgi:hypothetical protein